MLRWLVVMLLMAGRAAANPISFWDQPRKGANFFNRVESAERFQAA